MQVAAKQICAGEEVIDSVKNSILKVNKTTLSTMCLAELRGSLPLTLSLKSDSKCGMEFSNMAAQPGFLYYEYAPAH